MSTSTARATTAHDLHSTILDEGYGPGAWHGADMKAALAGVSSDTAFWRPGAARHNIAEIALHHAYCVRGVRAKLAGTDAEPFVVEGDDWFPLSDPSRLTWAKVRDVVEREHQRLSALVADIDGARVASPVAERERVALMLGITCHAVYHAGQVQLIRRLAAGE